MRKFDYTATGKPQWNDEVANKRRRAMLALMHKNGEISVKKEQRKTSHDAWIAKRRDKS